MRRYISAGTQCNTQTKHVPAPVLRKEFACKLPISNAVLQISAAGFYRVFLNGQELTKGYFAPYVSNPNHIVYYDEYDVVALLQEKNVVCVLLGNGFTNSLDSGVWGFESASYRAAPKVYMSLAADGREVLVTDETFEVYSSAITFDDYRLGESYDARRENKSILDLHCSAQKEGNAVCVSAPEGQYKKCEAQPVRAFERRRPVRVYPSEKGYVYDFGINDAGFCRLQIDGKEGQKITLRYGEFTQNGRLEVSNVAALYGKFSHLAHRDEYICKAGKQAWQPSFTYHGFRYVYVEGITAEQATEELLTYLVVHSDLPVRAKFSCNDAWLNKIQELSLRSSLACFHYFPTDCPQREKNGWTGDASLSCEQLLYNFDCVASLREWLHNVRKTQTAEGALPGIVPTDGWGYGNWSGPAWDSVIVELPYQIYRFTGDKGIIEENKRAIERYFSFLHAKRNEEGLISFGLGDWVEAGTVREDLYRTPVEVTGTLTCIALADKAEYLFLQVGDEHGAARINSFRKALTEKFRKKYVKEGFVSCRTQTAQAMALGLGMFAEDAERAYGNLLSLIREDGNTLRVGILGIKYLLDVLSDHGDCDLAVALVKGPNYPSYGYWLAHGMTTLNEAFVEFEEEKYPDELVRKDGRGQLISLNHHCWASVSAWFYKYLAGLRITRPAAAEIAPCFPRTLSGASAHFVNDGRSIAVEWRRENGEIFLSAESDGFEYSLRLPQGMRAELLRETGCRREYRIIG